MPKRSNQFQQVVTYIAEQLAPLGATVRESVELPEQGVEGTHLREVDTLIEATIGLTRVRIAVESRARSRRKDDIQWVDYLIGRYKLLGVDKVVGVSETGFSKGAKSKAALHNIELLSPNEVTGVDWPAEFHKLGVAAICGHLALTRIEFQTTPALSETLSDDRRVVYVRDAGDVVEGTLRGFIDEVGPRVIAAARAYLDENFLTIYKTLADLSKSAQIDQTMSNPRLTLFVGDAPVNVETLTFCVIVRTEQTIGQVAHRKIGDKALLSSTQVDDVKLVVAQVAGAPHAKVFVERQEKPKKRTRRG